MKILYIVPNPPSLVRVRPFNLIRHLQRRDHAITVATTWTLPGEWRDIESLRQHGIHVIAAPLTKSRIVLNLLKALITGTPFQAEYSWQPELIDQISSAQTQFDVIHVEHLRGAQYGLALRPKRPIVCPCPRHNRTEVFRAVKPGQASAFRQKGYTE